MVKKDGHKPTIFDVLYVHSMTSNLISISELLAKGYNMKMVGNQMKVYDGEERLILRAPLVDNKTFKIDINMCDHQYLAPIVRENKDWLWHHRYGHLNFIILSLLNMKKIVCGLPKIKEPSLI